MVMRRANHIGYVSRNIWIGSADELADERGPDTYGSVRAQLEDKTRLLSLSNGRWLVQLPDSFGFAAEFKSEKDARLYFGLVDRVGPFSTGESPTQNVPLEVAREGKDALAAYLLVGAGVRNSRAFVASKLGVSEQTVSNYANRVRFSG